MRSVIVQPGVTINLGHQYDNEATEVIFPEACIRQFTDIFGPEGNFYLWIIRSGDSEGYPVGPPLVVYSPDREVVTWTVTEADVASPGPLQVQLRYIAYDSQVMSKIFKAQVYDSIDIGSEIPEPLEPWADAIIRALQDVHGVPAGGTSGQVLGKASDDDWDLSWLDQSGGGSPSLPIVSFDGGSALGSQSVNTICRVSSVTVTDAPAGVALNTYVGWLWTYGTATNRHQILWYPHNAAVYQRIYRLYAGSYSWAAWTEISGSGSAVSPYTSNPAALGSASPGSSDAYSRGDHVHPKPSAADIGAIAAPASPATGAFLVWSGSAWIAQTLSVWQASSY